MYVNQNFNKNFSEEQTSLPTSCTVIRILTSPAIQRRNQFTHTWHLVQLALFAQVNTNSKSLEISLRKPSINPTPSIAMKKKDIIFNNTKHRLNSTQDIQIIKLERTISIKADEDYIPILSHN